jgi:hypothetical protein
LILTSEQADAFVAALPSVLDSCRPNGVA